jgi:16S rRNA (guanine(1405)-N(7))-methyltransferase
MDDLDRLVDAVRENPKYRAVDEGLVRRVGAQELAKGRGWKEAVKAARGKLHQVGGAYQEGGIRYAAWVEAMERLPRDLQHPDARDFCRRMLAQHASTKERLPILDSFFLQTLAGAAPISSVVDVACGLNPLALAWMPVAADVDYTACDIYADMIEFLNRFFEHFGIHGRARVCDLSAEVPQSPAQVALVLKTIPCLEQLDKNIAPRLLDGLQAESLLVTFPARSLGGRNKGMPEFYEAHFRALVEGRGWQVERYLYPSELAFVVHIL